MNNTILIFLVIFIFLCVIINSIYDTYFTLEGFTTTKNIKNVFSNNNLFDSFYCKIYNKLIGELPKNKIEADIITDESLKKFKKQIRVLDIGSGPGKHIFYLCENDYRFKPYICGLDNSKEMIKIAKSNNNDNYKNKCEFIKGDANNETMFAPNSFTHILCLYFTFYYFRDKNNILKNIRRWLSHKGHFCIHLVNRHKFDPMLDRGNPFIGSLQKYSDKRLTTSFVKFNELTYKSDFELDNENDIAYFKEEFENDVTKEKRLQKHTLYMPSIHEIVTQIKDFGFKELKVVDLMEIGYEYNYLYFFENSK